MDLISRMSLKARRFLPQLESFDQFFQRECDSENFAADLISRVRNLTRFKRAKIREIAKFNLVKVNPIKVTNDDTNHSLKQDHLLQPRRYSRSEFMARGGS